VAISNPEDLLSSSERGINPGIRSSKKHLPNISNPWSQKLWRTGVYAV
jgi:hypothetical protein